MKHLLTALAPAVALAASAAALPPPQPVVEAIPVATSGLPPSVAARFPRLVKAVEARRGYFVVGETAFSATAVKACGRRRDREACIRGGLLPKSPDQFGPITVAVVLQRAPNGLVRMTCVGPGKRADDPAAQSVLIDFDRALSADPRISDKGVNDAGGCIFAAMRERLI